MAKRAGLYFRTSRDEQAKDDRASPHEQKADCESLCERCNYPVAMVFEDFEKYIATYGKDKGKRVHPSSSRKDRPGYVKLCEAVREGQISVICAQSWDRIASGGAVELLLEAVEEAPNDVSVHTAWEGPMSKMQLRIMSAFREDEKERKRKRVIMAGRHRLKQGKALMGYQRYGYDYSPEKDAWVLNEEEAGWVREIFRLYVQGVQTGQIREILIREKAPQKRGPIKRPWNPNVIRQILKNEAYTGKAEIKWAGEVFEVSCPAIVPESVFNRAQERLAENVTWKNNNIKLQYLLSGMLRCGGCGNLWHSKGCRYRYKDDNGFCGKLPCGITAVRSEPRTRTSAHIRRRSTRTK